MRKERGLWLERTVHLARWPEVLYTRDLKASSISTTAIKYGRMTEHVQTSTKPLTQRGKELKHWNTLITAQQPCSLEIINLSGWPIRARPWRVVNRNRTQEEAAPEPRFSHPQCLWPNCSTELNDRTLSGNTHRLQYNPLPRAKGGLRLRLLCANRADWNEIYRVSRYWAHKETTWLWAYDIPASERTKCSIESSTRVDLAVEQPN